MSEDTITIIPQRKSMKLKIEVNGTEALNDFIPALLRKHDETSHKLAHIFIDAVTSSWNNAAEGYDHCKKVIEAHNIEKGYDE